MREFLQSPFMWNIIFSLATILIVYFITLLILRIINRSVQDLKTKYRSRKYTIYIATFITILIVILIWVRRGQQLVTIIGMLGAGLALALHQVILSIAGWILILIRKPYDVGDRIEIGGVKGDIIDIRLFYTSLLEIGNWVAGDQSTGRIIHIPNGKVFTEHIFNYTRGFKYIWNEIKFVITFESNWRKAKNIILETASKVYTDLGHEVQERIKKLSNKYLIHYDVLTPYVWTNIVDSGIELTLRYLTEAKKRRTSQEIICEAILDRFSQEKDIDFAYPTYRIYRKGEETENNSK